MKAISLWQPWALLWLLSDPDEKIFETRSWYTSHRGPLLVHAANKRDGEVRDFMGSSGLREVRQRHSLELEDFEFGALIGRVNLKGCSLISRMPEPSKREKMWGNWEPNRYAWERAPKPLVFSEPVPYKGAQGLFEVEL